MIVVAAQQSNADRTMYDVLVEVNVVNEPVSTSGALHNRDRTKVAAVIVTHNRLSSLKTSLSVLAEQSQPLRWIIVVDNAADTAVEAEVTRRDSPDGPRMIYLGSRTNLGGAGGFALGMLHALAQGAHWVWCADDDGRPDGPNVLETLLNCAEKYRLAAVSPVVCDISDHAKLAFPLRRGLRWRRRHEELFNDSSSQALRAKTRSSKGNRDRSPVPTDNDFLPGIANLFNGVLVAATTLEWVGVPDYRLFIRGDEVEFHRRLVRSGLPFGTCLTTRYLHPSGTEEFRPILNGLMHTQYPDDEAKRYFTYRNRGFVINQPGMRHLLPQEYARFAWFFLVKRRDPQGFIRWIQLHHQGRQEKFAPLK
ncbi:MAG: glycosyltransferase family 2 protein [Bowdeniella nasicola]|nr:glycosyltransferase family 2 protein [Bowdeniella nasicola]